MTASRSPIVTARGSTWLGDPDAPGFSIELGPTEIVLTSPSAVERIPWADIVTLDASIPTASWRLASAVSWLLAVLDAGEGAASEGAHGGTGMRRGNAMIEVRIDRRDGSLVRGWAEKHQVLGYPREDAEQAVADLQARIPG